MLSSAADKCGYVESRETAAQGHTGSVIGGHAGGTVLISDLAQAVACLQRAGASIQSAISELRSVDVMMWVPDD